MQLGKKIHTQERSLGIWINRIETLKDTELITRLTFIDDYLIGDIFYDTDTKTTQSTQEKSSRSINPNIFKTLEEFVLNHNQTQ